MASLVIACGEHGRWAEEAIGDDGLIGDETLDLREQRADGDVIIRVDFDEDDGVTPLRALTIEFLGHELLD